MTAGLVPGAIVTRSREPHVLRSMMMVSSVAHAAAIAALITASWSPRHPAEPVQIGVPGAPAALWTDIVAPSARAPKPQAMVEDVTPATPKPPRQRPSSSTEPAPPTTGAEGHSGSSHGDVDSTSSEGGLSTLLPGMNVPGANLNFCDPEYLGQMVALIHRNWRQGHNTGGKPIVRFLIQRDGTLTGITLTQPSGHPALDLEATRAVTLTRAIPPLPACYPHPHYAMNLTFEYTR